MYQNLLEKYRPKTLSDLVVTDELRDRLSKYNRVTPLILSGSSGIGKTTVAKIFGSEFNLIEDVDAAMDGNAEAIRNLIERSQKKSLFGKTLYIIDEAHNIATKTFDAFLKRFEEGTDVATFILCTTVPDKIPTTIHTRCQHIPIPTPSVEMIRARLEYIMDQENLKDYEVVSLQQLAEAADGSMREAVKLLEEALNLDVTLKVLPKKSLTRKFNSALMQLTFEYYQVGCSPAIESKLYNLITSNMDSLRNKLFTVLDGYSKFLSDVLETDRNPAHSPVLASMLSKQNEDIKAKLLGVCRKSLYRTHSTTMFMSTAFTLPTPSAYVELIKTRIWEVEVGL